MLKALGALAMAAVVLGACTGEKPPPPQVQSEPQPPPYQYEVPKSMGRTVDLHQEPDGVIECPLAPFDPATGQRVAAYTPPCTRQNIDGSGAHYIYDGRGVRIGGGTP